MDISSGTNGQVLLKHICTVTAGGRFSNTFPIVCLVIIEGTFILDILSKIFSYPLRDLKKPQICSKTCSKTVVSVQRSFKASLYTHTDIYISAQLQMYT